MQKNPKRKEKNWRQNSRNKPIKDEKRTINSQLNQKQRTSDSILLLKQCKRHGVCSDGSVLTFFAVIYLFLWRFFGNAK